MVYHLLVIKHLCNLVLTTAKVTIVIPFAAIKKYAQYIQSYLLILIRKTTPHYYRLITNEIFTNDLY